MAAILLFAPLIRAGQPPIPLLVLELLSVLLLVLVFWRPQHGLVTRLEAIALSLLFVFPLLYLVPVPGSLAEWLPGREQYLAGRSLLDGEGVNAAGKPSVYPLETESAWLVLLVPIAVFLGTRMLDSRRVLGLVLLLLAIAAFQAILGLMQFGDGKDSPLYLGMDFTHFGSAVGTYTNRNHLAGLLEMVLPLSLALLIYSVGRGDRDVSRGWRRRISFFASLRGHVAFGYGVLALVLLVGVIFTRSRTGIALTMLGFLLVSFAYSRRIGGDNVYGLAGTVVAFAVGIGIAIGLAPVLDRFSAEDALEDARWTIFSTTFDGIGAFFPLGSGPGNYPDVFPAFQPLELGRWFINHAHNDYLEWLFEGGLFAAVLILLFLALYLYQWTKVWTKDAWSRLRFVQVGAGIGILLMLLHTLVDYNLHIPANIVYFAFLAGIFFAVPEQEAVSGRQQRRKRRTPDLMESPESELPSVGEGPVSPPPDQIKNPFLDRQRDEVAPVGKDVDRIAAAGGDSGGNRNMEVGASQQAFGETDPSQLEDRIEDGEPAIDGSQSATEGALGETTDMPDPYRVEAEPHPSVAAPSGSFGESPPVGTEKPAQPGKDPVRRWEQAAPHADRVRGDREPYGILHKREPVPDLDDVPPASEPSAREEDCSISGAANLSLDKRIRRLGAWLSVSVVLFTLFIAGLFAFAWWQVEQLRGAPAQRPTGVGPDVSSAPTSPPISAKGPEQAGGALDTELTELSGAVREIADRNIVLSNQFSTLQATVATAAPSEDMLARMERLEALLGEMGSLLKERKATPRDGGEPDEGAVREAEIRNALGAPSGEGTGIEGEPAGEVGAPVTAVSGPVAVDAVAVSDPQEKPVTDEAGGESNRELGDGGEEGRILESPGYGIQLIAFNDVQSVAGFAGNMDLGPEAVYIQSNVKGRIWYLVVRGFFATHDDALSAVKELPEELGNLDPWIRPFPAGTRIYPVER
ncbi:MAG: O-antigen ligase family protein [Pseudomonadota bacterium]|nr:O-antigen ligase family protein [Pseudomonadota bacterium]